jgi:D-3-phosphoglycerate dehydrogenase / 2-oxoglutarate reductase
VSSLIVITDCDHPSIELERSIFSAAGYETRLARAHTPGQVIEAGRGAAALLTQYAPVTAAVFEALPDCRVVGRYGAGVDNIDVGAASARHVGVVSVPDYSVSEVSDHALALLLALSRGVVGLDRAVHAGMWDFRATGEIRRTGSLLLGVVGMGRIGRALATKAQAVGFRVIGHDPFITAVEGIPLVGLDELLASADAVSLHVPLSDATRHMIDAAALARMRSGVLLVNTSRGGLVDQTALLAALVSGHVGGAALDVVESEPLGADDPLLALPNVVVTPHAGFYSRESLEELKRRVAEGIVRALASESDAVESR